MSVSPKLCIFSDYCNFGTVAAGHGVKTAKKGWDVIFDVLPEVENIVENVIQSKLTVLAPGDGKSAEKIKNSIKVLQDIMREDNRN
jgi:predicted nucleotide-binding protein (sugar kinase/HSP70/actin superfamily)